MSCFTNKQWYGFKKIIFMTAYSGDDSLAEIIDKGLSEVIDKPINAEVLEKILKKNL